MNKDLKNYKGEDRIVTSHDYYKAVQALPPEKRYSFGIKSIDDLTEGFTHGDLITISGYTGYGKCHGKGTKILMYNGLIKNVEDIKVGDKLMGDNSLPRNVLSLANGKEMLYKISHRKDRTESYVVNESHILSLYNSHKKAFGGKGIKNISLKNYLNKSETFKWTHYCYKTGVKFKKQKINIDPYFIGLWLGDGTTSNVGVTTADNEIVKYLIKLAKKLELKVTVQKQKNNKANVYSLTREKKFKPVDKRCRKGYGKIKSLTNYLKELNLLNNKHIPNLYKINSKENRLKLLAGLIDSDGYNNGNCYEIIQKSKVLADDIVYLCRSLGLWAYHTIKHNKKYNKNYYRINIYGELFNVPALLKRKKCHKRKQIKNALHYSFNVKKLKIDNYYGFEIDGNHKYLLGDFTVTHNTSISQTISYNLSKQKIQTLWITYELSARQFFNKYKDADVPLFYMPRENSPYSLEWVEERVIEGIQKHNVKVIFIDHLDYVVPMVADGGNRTEMIGHTMRTLKDIARKYEIVIFLMVHTKQPQDTMPPTLGSLKGSSFIGQESDAVYIMHRPTKRGKRDEFEDYGTFITIKQRHTGIIGKAIRLEMHDKMFYDQINLEDEKAL